MLNSAQQRQLQLALQQGLPLCERPYAAVAVELGCSEAAVLEAIAGMHRQGLLRRFGVVVHHRELGYRANAMVVWDVPDELADTLGERLGRIPEVSLSYRRPRRLPDWPFNLFCMIHGKDRRQVLATVDEIIALAGLSEFPHRVLFSTRRFKQQGADYVGSARTAAAAR